jgi:hypothetical protein
MTLGAILGGGAISILGGALQGQERARAQSSQQDFLESVFRARQESPLTQRIFQLLGIRGAGGGQTQGVGGVPVAPGAVSPGTSRIREAFRGRGQRIPRPGEGQAATGLLSGGLGEQAPNPAADLAGAIARVQERGVVRGQQRAEQGLLSALGRGAGISGGLGARAVSQLRGQLPGRLADVEAGRLQTQRTFERQDIADLLNALQVTTPAPGGVVPGLAESLGQTGGGIGGPLSGLGNTLGTFGVLQGLGLLGGDSPGGVPSADLFGTMFA